MAITIKERVLLAPYTIFKIGGLARFFVEVQSTDEVVEALQFATQKGIPFFIFGAGSNMLVSDEGFDGIAIHMMSNNISFDGERVIVDAGVMMPRLSAETVREGLVGFEWGGGVPGTLGGSVRGNAGCFGGEMCDSVERVTVAEVQTGSLNVKLFELTNKECEFGYRESIFKRHPEWIILSAILQLQKMNPLQMKSLQNRVVAKNVARVQEQPIGAKTAGSTFKGVFIDESVFANLLKKQSMWQRGHPNTCWLFENRRGFMSAGFLIDHAGLKGYRIGDAQVSERHANFIINVGDARARDVAALITMIKKKIYEFYGVQLEEEIQYIGFPQQK